MGWLGLGLLLVSASYILYRHPRFSWVLGRWHSSQEDSRPIAPAARAEETPQSTAEQFGKGINQDGDPVEDIGSSESTPKAAATQAPPTLTIPQLNLDDVDIVEDPAIPSVIQAKDRTSNLSSDLTSTPKTYLSSSDMRQSPSPTPSISMPPPSLPPTLSAASKPATLMPPPPRIPSNVPLRPPPSAASSLRAPPPRVPAGSRLSSSTLSPLGLKGKPQNSSRQVTLEPGHSPLDWAALTADPRNNLRGKDAPPNLVRVTPSMLKLQNGRKGRDVWTSYQGKVYNITPYLPFHPGGKKQLLRGAGRDSAELFLEIHPWVNWDGMLAECMVGILVSENDQQHTSPLDEMD